MSPRDPDQRLQTLVKETQSRLVLVHRLTQERFDMNQTTVNIDAVIGGNIFAKAVTIAHLSEVIVTGDSIAYIIFTSGSTGIPKAVSSSATINDSFYDYYVCRLKYGIEILLNLFDHWFRLVHSVRAIPYYRWLDVLSIFMLKISLEQ